MAYWLERAPLFDKNVTTKTSFAYPAPKVAQVSWDPATNTITPDTQLPSWVFTTKLVAKPDQLIKRRGKAGLLALNKTWEEAKEWIQQRAGKPQKVSLSIFLPRPLLSASIVQSYLLCAAASPASPIPIPPSTRGI